MSFLTKSADENFKYYMKYDFKFCRQLLFVVVHSYFQVAKIAKKNGLKECVFVNSALKIQCILSKIHSYTTSQLRQGCCKLQLNNW